ncbi:hypothetical protein HUB97_02070 [Halorubraceae archaeon YAN]|nr:hypothetical protein [Halorubraceae archaeon YAN]
MSIRKTVNAHTPHGDVSYEVITCVNCGEEVVPEDAVMVGIGFEAVRCDGLPICRATHEAPTEVRALCEYCAEGILSYQHGTTGDVKRRLVAFTEEASPVGVGVWLGTAIATTLLVAIVFGTVLLGLSGLV